MSPRQTRSTLNELKRLRVSLLNFLCDLRDLRGGLFGFIVRGGELDGIAGARRKEQGIEGARTGWVTIGESRR